MVRGEALGGQQGSIGWLDEEHRVVRGKHRKVKREAYGRSEGKHRVVKREA